MNLKLALLLLGTLLLTQSAFAQRWNLTQKHSIDIVTGGDYGFRSITGDRNNPTVPQLIANRQKNEVPKFNYRIGVNYSYFLTDKLFIKSGIRLSNPGFKTGLIADFDPTSNINLVEKIHQDDGIEAQFEYIFLEIPTLIRYVYSGTWCRSFLEAGFSSNFYLHSIITKTHQDGTKERTITQEEIRRYNLIGNLSLGAEMEITKDIAWFIQLNGRYQFANLRRSQITERIGSAGVETGVRFLF